ncbi:MAG: CvpA family protein [Chthoniobacterales bacterium]
MIELGISIVALVAIVYGGMHGAKEGLFWAFARLCLGLLGFIAAIRFWYLGTDFLAAQISVSPEQVAFAAFWGIFVLVVMPPLIGIKTLNNDFIPAYPIPLERFAGFLFGAGNAVVLASAMLLSLTLNIPSVLSSYDETKLLLPIHRLPTLIYRSVETRLTHVTADSPSHTLLPVGQRSTPQSALEVRWK